MCCPNLPGVQEKFQFVECPKSRGAVQQFRILTEELLYVILEGHSAVR
jgi:hypothetical protein